MVGKIGGGRYVRYVCCLELFVKILKAVYKYYLKTKMCICEQIAGAYFQNNFVVFEKDAAVLTFREMSSFRTSHFAKLLFLMYCKTLIR